MKCIRLAVTCFLIPLAVSCGGRSPAGPGQDEYNPQGHWGRRTLLSSVFQGCSDPAVSADGRVLYVSRRDSIYCSQLLPGGWSSLTPLPFSGMVAPCISFDGNTLYCQGTRDSAIYCATRSGTAWSILLPLFPGRTPSVTQDGRTMYYSSFDSDLSTLTLQYATLDGGIWTPRGGVAELNSLISSGSLTGLEDPAISGDGTLLLFVSPDRQGAGWETHYRHLYASRKGLSGWESPTRPDADLFLADETYAPCVSWDKRTLYFFAQNFYYDRHPLPDGGLSSSTWVNQ